MLMITGPRARARRAHPSGLRAAFCLGLAGVLAPVLDQPTQAADSLLPRLAVTVSPANKTVAERDEVAPVLAVDLGAAGAATVEALREAVGALPENRPLRSHVRVRVAGPVGSGRADETALEQRATEVAAALLRGGNVGRDVILEVEQAPENPGALQFALAALVLHLKSVGSTPGEVALVFPPGLVGQQPDLARRLAVYADVVGIVQGPAWRAEAEWVREELHKPVLLRLEPGAALDREGVGALVLDDLAAKGSPLAERLWTEEASAAALAQTLRALSANLRATFASAEEGSVPFAVRAEGDPLVARGFVDGFSPDVAFLVRAEGSLSQPRRIAVSAEPGVEFDLACHDGLDGHALPARPAAAEGGRPVRECSVDGTWAVLSMRRGETEQRTYELVNVSGRGGLSVEEIVARWRRYRTAQERELANYTAACLLSLHFEATTLGSGFDLALQLRQFVDDKGHRDWVQDAFFVNGVRYRDARGFPLAQLEPEKVMAQPLELALEEKYRYTLLGVDTVDGAPAFEVGVEPEAAGELLFSGKVWIDGVSFRQVRVQLQQSGGRSTIRSHVETQDWGLVSAGGRPFNLPQSVYVQQILSAAGRNVLLERTYRFSDYQVNSPGFEAALAEASASEKRMFRDTDEGLRVLRREGGQRVVEISTTRMSSLLVGLLYEGSYDFPIPLAGVSFVDHDFGGSGGQLSVFFAGPLGAANFSKQVSKRLRVGADLALTALALDNKVWDGDLENEGERVRTREETFGVLATWQALPSLSLTGSSYVSANIFRPAEDTLPAFDATGRGFTVQSSAELKAARRGFALTATALHGRRFGWSELGGGEGGAQVPRERFLKWSGELTKQFYLGSFSKAVLTAGYYGGEDLDRYSRYQPSFLSRPRIRGIPGGTDTFDSVGVVGVQYGFNVFEAVKLEGIYNRAWGRNLQEAARHRTFDGLELDLGTVGPWGTFLQGTFTYALGGNLERYNSRWGAYLLVFRPLGR